MWFSDLLTQFAIECLRYTFLWVWLYGMLFAHYFFFWFWWLALARSYAAPGSPDSSVFLSQLQSLHFSCWCFSTVIKHGLFLPRTSWLCTPLSICPCTPQSLPGSAVFLITPALDCSIFSSCGFFFFFFREHWKVCSFFHKHWWWVDDLGLGSKRCQYHGSHGAVGLSPPTFICFCFETWSPVSQAGLHLAMQLQMTLDTCWSSWVLGLQMCTTIPGFPYFYLGSANYLVLTFLMSC